MSKVVVPSAPSDPPVPSTPPPTPEYKFSWDLKRIIDFGQK